MELLTDYARHKNFSNIRYIIRRGEDVRLQSGRRIDSKDYMSCSFLFSSRGTYKLSPKVAFAEWSTLLGMLVTGSFGWIEV